MSVEAPAAPEAVESQITESTPAAVETNPASVADAVESSGVDGGPVESSGIDEGLSELARSYGINPERWQDADALQSAITQIDRAYAHHLNQAAQQYKTQQPAQGQQPLQSATPAQPRPKLNFKELLPEADYDDKIRNALSQVYDDLASQLSEAQSKLAAYDKHGEKLQEFETFRQEALSRQQQQEAVQLETRLDTFFGGLGKEWEDLFGKGDMRNLSPRSPQAANRNAYVAALKQIEFIDAGNGVRPNAKSQEQRALHLAFGEQLPTIERRKLAHQANERRNGALTRPASKNGRPLDPNRKIEADVQEWIAKVGQG